MHNHIISASIQIVPIVADKHPYAWVDEAIDVIIQSGVKYEVSAFSTILEGSYIEVMKLIDAVNQQLYTRGCAEWISNVQIQIRSAGDVTNAEKTEKFKQ
jgi:uncharacterized protein YqgV (UPF0045/DUF77 family)